MRARRRTDVIHFLSPLHPCTSFREPVHVYEEQCAPAKTLGLRACPLPSIKAKKEPPFRIETAGDLRSTSGDDLVHRRSR
ncbi:hypothetical protein EVAR_3621_1 [Eumeta japonica]|uniref:Uncharacterized protein n=1 Tax=Eumeta variegata TaxID=151549 RepID=A0A4C1SYE8_EUMVA|nr:hypothetical protein EVAR_3621_1 [Eumeta japonica]